MSTTPQSLQKPRNHKRRWIFAILGFVLVGGIVLFFIAVRAAVRVITNGSEGMDPTLVQRDRLLVDRLAYDTKGPQRGDIIAFDAPPGSTPNNEKLVFVKRVMALPGDSIQITPPRLLIKGKEIVPTTKGIGAGATGVHTYLREHLGLADNMPLKIFRNHLLVGGKTTVSLEELASRLKQPITAIALTPGQVVVNGKPLEEPYINEDPDYAFPSRGESFTVVSGKVFVLGDNRNHSLDSIYFGPLAITRISGQVTQILEPSDRAGKVP